MVYKYYSPVGGTGITLTALKKAQRDLNMNQTADDSSSLVVASSRGGGFIYCIAFKIFFLLTKKGQGSNHIKASFGEKKIDFVIVLHKG